ncbi:MAG: hypothetical protein J6V98_08060 [Bacteroidales bacterium]|nr:hypothetical protein [Bacteroidales bacterium]
MKRLRNILIPCLLALLCTPFAALAQQSREQMAAYYFDHGDFAQAAQLYESLYQRGNNKFYYQRLLATYLEMEQYKEALKLVQQRQKTAPRDLYLLVDEGNVQLRQGQEKKALKCFDKAIAQISNNLQPIPDLAMAFLTAGRPSYAAQTYLTARSKTRNNTLYFNELIGVYQQMGDYEAMTGEYFDLLDHQPGMMQSIQISMQRTLKEAPDGRLADGVRRALVSRIQEHPENRNYLEMMIWFSIQQNDYRFALEQAQAVDARFPESGGDQVMRVAQIAQNNGAFDVAVDGYRHLQQKGPDNAYYFDSRVGELEVEFARINHNYSIDSKSFAQLREKYLAAFAELGKNERTLPLMRHYATLIAYHGGDVQEAVSMLDDALELPRLKAKTRDEVKLELGDLLLFAGETWDASLLYMQVEKANKDDILGASAKYRNAKLSYYNHDFEWAKSQLNVLRASTSKLIANDAMELSLLISDNMEDDSTYGMLEIFADADLMLYRNRLDSAWSTFDRITRLSLSHPLFDEVLMRKAQIRMKQARYDEADSLLQRLIDFYPTDITADDALIMRAELNEQQLGRPDVALSCYEKLLLDYPSSLYADQARKRYNALKAR